MTPEPAQTGRFPETSRGIPGKRRNKISLLSLERNQKIEFREDVSQPIDPLFKSYLYYLEAITENDFDIGIFGRKQPSVFSRRFSIFVSTSGIGAIRTCKSLILNKLQQKNPFALSISSVLYRLIFDSKFENITSYLHF